jgi:hypothetical protein
MKEAATFPPEINTTIVAREIKSLLTTLTAFPNFRKTTETKGSDFFTAHIDFPADSYSIRYGKDEQGEDLAVLRFLKQQDGKKRMDASIDLTTDKTASQKVRLRQGDRIVTGYAAINLMEEIFPEFFNNN